MELGQKRIYREIKKLGYLFRHAYIWTLIITDIGKNKTQKNPKTEPNWDYFYINYIYIYRGM